MDPISRTVLIVDDDPAILRLVEKMLRPRGFNIRVAPRPSQALEICESEPVYLLITDIAMPEMDGLKLMQKIRQTKPETPVLLISGHYSDDPVKHGANVKFLKKPFFPADLVSALKELLPEL